MKKKTFLLEIESKVGIFQLLPKFFKTNVNLLVPEIGVFAGDEDGAGDVGAGLISVEGKCAPPVRD